MPEIKIDDLNLYYEIHGKGFPLIMIMGISGDTYWWDSAIIEELSGNTEWPEVIFFRLQGVRSSLRDLEVLVLLGRMDRQRTVNPPCLQQLSSILR